MRELEDRIRQDGRVMPGNILLVDSFLNQGLDAGLMNRMALTWKAYFEDEAITKIMTVEASGIALAALTAYQFEVPALFAKKYATINLTADRHQASVYSYTREQTYTIAVSKRLLTPEDRVLLIDDFLANGCAMAGLADLVQAAGASVAGIGVAIEKSFQTGAGLLRERGLRVCALARIQSFEDGRIVFGEADA